MSFDLTVLVLGVGGNVSQGILKALSASTLRCRVVTGCVTSSAIGLYTEARGYLSPPAADAGFTDWVVDVCRREGVDAVLSGVEPVLDVLARDAARLEAESSATAVVSPPAALAIGADKLTTCAWLRERDFAWPRYADGADPEAVRELVAAAGFPLIVKPRRGKGATGVRTLRDAEELARALEDPGVVVQELLGDEREEYTVGCVSDRNGRVRGALAMRRDLAAGTTVRAEAGSFPAVRAEAVAIAGAIGAVGPTNVQLRMHHGRPTCFEVNVRFSGTTPIRARLGFNDVEATLRHIVLGEPATDMPLVTRGVVLRYVNEVYVDPDRVDELERTGRVAVPTDARTVEGYGGAP